MRPESRGNSGSSGFIYLDQSRLCLTPMLVRGKVQDHVSLFAPAVRLGRVTLRETNRASSRATGLITYILWWYTKIIHGQSPVSNLHTASAFSFPPCMQHMGPPWLTRYPEVGDKAGCQSEAWVKPTRAPYGLSTRAGSFSTLKCTGRDLDLFSVAMACSYDTRMAETCRSTTAGTISTC